MQNTTNYNLNKPEGNDYAKIQALNENADIIDAELKKIEENSTKIIVSETNIPVAERKPSSFYFIVTDSAPTPTSPNITVSPTMGLRKVEG